MRFGGRFAELCALDSNLTWRLPLAALAGGSHFGPEFSRVLVGEEMGLGQEEVQIEAWGDAEKAKESTVKKNKSVKRVEEREEQPGCWIRIPLMGSCMSSRSKVDTSISSASTRCGEFNRY